MELWALTTIVKKKETRAKNIPEMILPANCKRQSLAAEV